MAQPGNGHSGNGNAGGNAPRGAATPFDQPAPAGAKKVSEVLGETSPPMASRGRTARSTIRVGVARSQNIRRLLIFRLATANGIRPLYRKTYQLRDANQYGVTDVGELVLSDGNRLNGLRCAHQHRARDKRQRQ